MKKFLILIVFALFSCGENKNQMPLEAAVAKASEQADPQATTEEETSTKTSKSAAAPDCIDLLPEEVKKDVVFKKCDGSDEYGTLEATIVERKYEPCKTDGETDCIANISYPAGTPVVAETHHDCTGNGQKGCVANDDFPSNNVDNLIPSNVKSGVTIANVTGIYEPAVQQCGSNGQIGCLASPEYPANNVVGLIPSALKTGVTVAGVSGTFDPQVESHVECSTQNQTGCLTSTNWKPIAQADYAKLIATNIKKDVVIAGVTGSLLTAVAPDPFDIRKGLVVNGVTGLLQTRCRNSDTSAPADEKCAATGWHSHYYTAEAAAQGMWALSTDSGAYKLTEDTYSGLYWLANMDGPTPTTGTSKSSAMSFCSARNINGLTGWRLPTREEMQQAVLNRITGLLFANDIGIDVIGWWVGPNLDNAYVSNNGSVGSSPYNISGNVTFICVKTAPLTRLQHR